MLCLLQRYSTWHTFLKKVRWLSLFRATCFRWFRCVATIVSFWRNQNFGYYPKILDVTPFSKESTRLSSSFHKILYIFLFFVDREPSRIESVHVWILIYDFFLERNDAKISGSEGIEVALDEARRRRRLERGDRVLSRTTMLHTSSNTVS